MWKRDDKCWKFHQEREREVDKGRREDGEEGCVAKRNTREEREGGLSGKGEKNSPPYECTQGRARERGRWGERVGNVVANRMLPYHLPI